MRRECGDLERASGPGSEAGGAPFQFALRAPESGELPPISGSPCRCGALRALWSNRAAAVCLLVLAAALLFLAVQPHLPGQKIPGAIHNDPVTGIQLRNAAPCGEFLFGTNSIGQDLWSLVWQATRNSLFIGFSVACVEVLAGVAAGVLWGYARRVEALFTELYNVFANIPRTLVLILISYIARPGMATVILALCLTGWLPMARLVRNRVVALRDREYNLASRCLGSPVWRIVVRNLLPYLVPIIVMRAAMAVPAAIGSEVFVSYIGLGLPVTVPSLGNLITSGIDKMMEPALRHQLLIPTAVLCVISVSFYVVGSAAADVSDPQNI